jgi:hypothetical protein
MGVLSHITNALMHDWLTDCTGEFNTRRRHLLFIRLPYISGMGASRPGTGRHPLYS